MIIIQQTKPCFFRKFLVISLLSVLLTSPMSTNTSEVQAKIPKGIKQVKTYGGINEYQLENGLKILLKPDLSSPLISWQVWYKAGSRNEKPGITGIAHYLEHMMFKGTKLFDKGEISQSIQLRGGIFNAFTGDDYTAYFENFSPEYLEFAIKLEADRMRNSRLDNDEIDLERSVIVSELEGGENNPTNILYKTLKSTAFTAHSYKNPIIGWHDDLVNINSTNMREFYDTFYQPNNATVILLGNFETDSALELIKKHFGKYKASELNYPAVSKEPKQEGQRKTTIQKEGLVKLLALGFHIPEFGHEDYPALSVISDVLFGGTTSRAYKKLVDSNKVTNISGYAEAGIDPGLMRIIANVSPDTDINEVEKILDEELESVKSGITDEELERAKARVEASAIYDRDGVYHQGIQIGYFNNMGRWESYVDWVEIINKISNKDIKEVARKYFTKSNKTSVHLLPEKAQDSLLAEASADLAKAPAARIEYGYGAGTVEKLSPDKLKKLLKLTEPDSKFKKKKAKLDLKTQRVKFDRNIDLIYKEDHDPELIYINAVFAAGAINNPIDKPGLAAVTAEMVQRGTKKRDKFALAGALDLLGADVNFASKKEVAELEISTLSKNFTAVLEIFQEIIDEPAFSQEELDKLKAETIANIKQENEYPSTIVAREVNRLIYPADHPYYSFTPEEKIKAIESIKIEDVKAFYEANYQADNLKISVVGDISLDKIKQELLPVLETWNKGKTKSRHTNPYLDYDDDGFARIKTIEKNKPQEKIVTLEGKQQVEILMGHAGEVDRFNPDFYPLLIANYALGGSALSSKLGTVVRDEHGYVYDIRSGVSSTLGAGKVYLSLGCNPKNARNAINLSKETVKEFLKEGISKTELEATKAYIGGSFAGRNLSSNEDMSQTFSHLLLYDLDSKYIENYADLINSISIEDVNRVARKYIDPDKFNIVIAGPKID